MDWKECISKKIIKEIKTDEELMNSLIKTSENNLISSEELKLSETTAGPKLTLAYDSLRELLEILALKKEYKIYNHECYTAFLKEILNEYAIGEEFDEIRKIRNLISYYGRKISTEESQKTIVQIKNLRRKILNLIKAQ